MNNTKPNIGDCVRVKADQSILGKPQYPNRVGIVKHRNSVDPNYVYVELEATKRSPAKRELFHENQLEIIPPCLSQN